MLSLSMSYQHGGDAVLWLLLLWQEAELRAKAKSREMARNAVGVLGGGGDARHKQRQYAEELEEQLRMKKVRRVLHAPQVMEAC